VEEIDMSTKNEEENDLAVPASIKDMQLGEKSSAFDEFAQEFKRRNRISSEQSQQGLSKPLNEDEVLQRLHDRLEKLHD
jgi:hypothetical protein